MTTRPTAVDATVIWEALIADSDAGVLILDSKGVIEFANERAVEMFGLRDGAACVGHPLAEFVPPDVFRDRMSLAQESLAAGRAVTVEGMIAGRLQQSTFRPIPGSAGAPASVLVVSRLAGPSDPLSRLPSPGTVRAHVDDPGALGVLTAREMEILKLIGLGLSSAEIARRLERSVKTVEWHRVSLGDKLGVSNRVELARIAIGAGLVGVDPTPPGAAAKPVASADRAD
ncbi:MAG: LuxR C-terminal-related transcriptional regulator [Planctomycetota bacterium]|nr:LuxR C-terminal-related transcriptional regulator [Planctomycetota bacterium]